MDSWLEGILATVVIGGAMTVMIIAAFSAGQSAVINDCAHLGGLRYNGKIYDCTMQERTAQSQKQSNQTMKEI